MVVDNRNQICPEMCIFSNVRVAQMQTCMLLWIGKVITVNLMDNIASRVAQLILVAERKGLSLSNGIMAHLCDCIQ